MICSKLLSSLLLATIAIGSEGAEMTGYIVDNQCINLCENKTDGCAPDGSNAFYSPQRHTGWCKLIPSCEESGYTLMSEKPDTDGKHTPILSFSGDAAHAAVVDYVKKTNAKDLTFEKKAHFPLVKVVYDDDNFSVTSDGTPPQVVDVTVMDPWSTDHPAFTGADVTQTICNDASEADIDENNMCFRSDISVTKSEDMFIIESGGCPDHGNMKGGSGGTVTNNQETLLDFANNGNSGGDTCSEKSCGGCSSDKCDGGCTGNSDKQCGGCSGNCCSGGDTCNGGCTSNSDKQCGGCSGNSCGGRRAECAGDTCNAGGCDSKSCSAGCCSGGCDSSAGCCSGGCDGCTGNKCCSGGCDGCTGNKCCSGGCDGCTGNNCCSDGCCGSKCGDSANVHGDYDPMYQHYRMMIPMNPGEPGEATPISNEVGLMNNGVLLDTHEQTWSYDMCTGHSDTKHQYHYHLPPTCFLESMGMTVPDSNWWINDNGNEVRDYKEMAAQWPNKGSSPVVGYAKDGFPIYALYDSAGNLQRSKLYGGELDECNGKDDGNGYGYYITSEPPFVPTCLRGTIGSFSYAPTQIACPSDGITTSVSGVRSTPGDVGSDEGSSDASYAKLHHRVISFIAALAAFFV